MHELQRASLLKRFSAFLLDVILLVVLITGFTFMMSAITHYDSYNDKMSEHYKTYLVEYDLTLGVDMSKDYVVIQQEILSKYEALTDAEKEEFNTKTRAMSEAMNKDQEVRATYSTLVNLSLINITVGTILAVTIIYFVLPIIFKNGQTLGMKLFNLCLVKPNSVRINNMQLFINAYLGHFAIETMAPILLGLLIYFGIMGIIGIMVLVAITLLNVILIFATKDKSAIHDLLAGTVVVDKSSQMIFASEEERIKYIESLGKSEAKQQKYF